VARRRHRREEKIERVLVRVKNTYLFSPLLDRRHQDERRIAAGTRTPLIVDGIPVVCCDAGNCPNEIG